MTSPSDPLSILRSLAAEENGETDNAFEAEYEATRRQLLLSLFFSDKDLSQ